MAARHFVLATALAVGAIIFAMPKEDAKAPSCSSDWHKCSDNEDLINNYNGPHFAILNAKLNCISAAGKVAKYGTPLFPDANHSFRSFYGGNEYTKTGSVILVEGDAQFSNAFGGMVHSTVTCTYSLDQTTVLDVKITPH